MTLKPLSVQLILEDLPRFCEDGKYNVMGDAAYPLREYLLVRHFESTATSLQKNASVQHEAQPSERAHAFGRAFPATLGDLVRGESYALPPVFCTICALTQGTYSLQIMMRLQQRRPESRTQSIWSAKIEIGVEDSPPA
ncbi:hypothetical protein HPB50_013908 [Hyalomma asiaticum]|uniref:Uncharacterized protein n=1 Tax=Hyalomma asiaticum TaxID=266040 RepID=A0ACB7SN38_HYAAI|nr:hypothetical protein HPB50_013908 [Hyalomma asiaticum]